jgi:hypothetical protein
MILKWQEPYEPETVTISREWTPDALTINALPAPLRNYIHLLQTDCDPAGTIRENVLIKDENQALRLRIAELTKLRGKPSNR